MKFIVYISIFILASTHLVKAQDAVAAEAQRRHQEKSYLSGHLDYAFTYLNGTGGNERAQYYEDYIQDLNNNGIIAEGGLYGRHGVSFGVSWDQFLSKRYAIHYQGSYWQTGYREKLNVSGETEFGSITQTKLLKANLNYLHLLGGLKYYSDYGITLTLGAFVNYNIVDKVKNEESSKITGRFGESDTTVSEELYFHEYFGQNRTVFLTGGVFSIGFKWNDLEFDASIKSTGPILDVIDDKIFNVYQFGIRYSIPTRPED